MNRARAAWVAACVLLLAAVGYLVVRRRRGSASPAVVDPRATAAVEPRVTAVPLAGTSTPDEAEVEPPLPAESDWPMNTEFSDLADDTERPLATWIRVAIVVAALVAFFAVSLVATKQV